MQSVLLGIIHELLALGKFELLVPTVHVWAIDVVDVVIELGDEKVTNIPGPIDLQLNIIFVSLTLRTVPTFVSSHTFWASCKAWFNCHARTRVGIDVITYATKMKANVSYCVAK